MRDRGRERGEERLEVDEAGLGDAVHGLLERGDEGRHRVVERHGRGEKVVQGAQDVRRRGRLGEGDGGDVVVVDGGLELVDARLGDVLVALRVAQAERDVEGDADEGRVAVRRVDLCGDEGAHEAGEGRRAVADGAAREDEGRVAQGGLDRVGLVEEGVDEGREGRGERGELGVVEGPVGGDRLVEGDGPPEEGEPSGCGAGLVDLGRLGVEPLDQARGERGGRLGRSGGRGLGGVGRGAGGMVAGEDGGQDVEDGRARGRVGVAGDGREEEADEVLDLARLEGRCGRAGGVAGSVSALSTAHCGELRGTHAWLRWWRGA